VATLPPPRRRGLGAAITGALVDDARAAGVETIFLSAAGDDVARVYERLGFEARGLRRGYYTDNHEDALIMWREPAVSAGAETA